MRTVKKNCYIDQEFFLRSLHKTICLKSERSEHFFVKECWRFLFFNKLEQLQFKFEKMLEFRNMLEKLENVTLSCIFFTFTIFDK